MISTEGHSFLFKPYPVVFLSDSTSNCDSASLSLWDQYKRPCGLRLLVLYSALRGFFQVFCFSTLTENTLYCLTALIYAKVLICSWFVWVLKTNENSSLSAKRPCEVVHNCSQVCYTDNNNTAKCACFANYELQSDGKTCLGAIICCSLKIRKFPPNPPLPLE